MPTISVILNIVFSVGMVVVITGGLFFAMATQHRDHNVLAARVAASQAPVVAERTSPRVVTAANTVGRLCPGGPSVRI